MALVGDSQGALGAPGRAGAAVWREASSHYDALAACEEAAGLPGQRS